MGKGLLITFEGLDGCGKSLMMRKLGKWLRTRGCSVETTCEPGWGEMGQSIRKLLLNSAFGSVDERTEALLYAADRANHCAAFIRPQLEAGKIILCDRFFDSTLAYQGFGRGLDLDSLLALQNFAIGSVRPDLTIFLRVPVEVSFSRIRGKKDRLEQEDKEFFERVLAGYDKLAAREPNRFRVIDSGGPIDQVFSTVVKAILPLLKG
ncbi:MAG: dTMP kinase [Bacillota bacterium]|nr:dTMP kinase [Bacillota bacterium]